MRSLTGEPCQIVPLSRRLVCHKYRPSGVFHAFSLVFQGFPEGISGISGGRRAELKRAATYWAILA
jgi:hypothetical protein